MKRWFTVERIDPDTFSISEYGHWEETHCYLLRGEDTALLIDSGLGVANLKEVVETLTDLPVTVAATHVHWDHIGGHGYFSNLAVHEAERDWLNGKFPLPLDEVKRSLLGKPCQFPPDFDPDRYQIFQGAPTRTLRDGDRLDLGGRRIEVIHTPGHSPGHCCFYEPERKYLFSGDLVYRGCLDVFYPTTDPQLFLQSLRKIQPLEIGRILPGHHRLDLPSGMVDRIERGFAQLQKEKKLVQGGGLFDFGDFQIHL